MKILDCTLRDGGYYTNWDFNKDLVSVYCKAMESLPIDYVEIGYRSPPIEGYLGEYFYCPEYVMQKMKEMMPSKKLAILLNEKDIKLSNVNKLLSPCKDYITMVRIALNPANLLKAFDLAKSIKKMGFEVAFNVMYMSEWKNDNSFLESISLLDDSIDYFYLVDSFGGVFQEDIKQTIMSLKEKTNLKLGFHGHNNLDMALANTITAINEGCEIIDSTITGMGRGAGNLRTELLLIYLDSKKNFNIKYDNLSDVVSLFEELKKQFNWGTNLPYMFSGAYSLPQKQVMEWIGLNRYSIASILNALNNKKASIDDNFNLPSTEIENKCKDILIIGGGNSVLENKKAIEVFLKQNIDITVIHTGLKYIKDFEKLENNQFYSFVGFEGDKLLDVVKEIDISNKQFVYPPHPRKMGTLIPDVIMDCSYQLEKINFTKVSNDSPLAIAIQIALNHASEKIYFVGFDGYDNKMNNNQLKLIQENQNILQDLLNLNYINIVSLTSTKYENLKHSSIYSIIK